MIVSFVRELRHVNVVSFLFVVLTDGRTPSLCRRHDQTRGPVSAVCARGGPELLPRGREADDAGQSEPLEHAVRLRRMAVGAGKLCALLLSQHPSSSSFLAPKPVGRKNRVLRMEAILDHRSADICEPRGFLYPPHSLSS